MDWSSSPTTNGAPSGPATSSAQAYWMLFVSWN
jgi:hypothetical protein